LDIRIEVDGGINLDNIGQVREAGADMFVAGSAIFNTSDYRQTISQLKQSIS
jgi:ribulose-phosphate 3-epimerase